MDENKYFLINRGQIKKRLDPYYFKKEFIDQEVYLNSLGNRVSVIRNSAIRIFSGLTPLSKGDAYTSKELGIPFIRSGDYSEDNIIDFENLVYLRPDIHFKQMKNSKLLKGDVLIAIVGATIGKVGIYNYEKEANINQAICSIRLRNNTSPNYLQVFYLTPFGQKIIDRAKRPVARANINLEEIGALPFIQSSPLKQKTVVDIFNLAIKVKQERENKTNKLFRLIDEYLLKEVGITLPIQQENSINNRIFNTGWKKVTGNRFDPKKYCYQNENLIACIENSKMRKVPLKSLVVHSVSGDWGFDEKEEVNPKLFTKCLVIRATEFDNNYNLKIENSRAKFRLISNTKLKKLDIKPQDFLLEKSGGSPDQPVGRISILENELLENNTIAYSNFIHKFRVNTDEVLPEFLFCFLKTIHNIKLTDVMQSQTNGIRNLIMREYWNQSIILPDKKKQKEIAVTIYHMRAEAKQTEIDAQHGFKQTKKEIEKLILE